MDKRARRRWRGRLASGLARATGLVPAPLTRGVLALGGRVAARGTYGRRTLANLELALGDERSPSELERIARGVFHHSARQVQEWLRLARSGPPGDSRGAWIEEHVEIDLSIERLEGELARGRGALVVTAHLGNWELLAAVLRRRGLEGAVVGRTRGDDPDANWLVRMRERVGLRTIPQDSSPRRLLEVLHRGQVLGLLCDLEVRRLDGEFLPFFGVPALTMTAPAALARAHRTPLVPVRCVLRGERYRLLVEEPLELDPGLSRRQATTDLLSRMNARFEAWIREDPEQWAWHQHRWRTRPGDYDAVPLAERHRINASRRRRY